MQQSVRHLRKAVLLAQYRTDIRFNYAKALIKAGNKNAARSEREMLQAAGSDFASKSEIVSMLRSL